MHIVKFRGGFANQLFQLCLYRKLQEKYGKDNVFAEISIYKIYKDHGGFKLGKYGILSFVKKLPEDYVGVDETTFHTINAEVGKTYCYNGYWQDESFFPESIDFINDILGRSELSRENKELISLMGTSESVSVHVRRGDYNDHFLHGNIATGVYYHNATNYIRSRIERPVFFVFSDDQTWCHDNLDFGNDEVYFVSGNEKTPEADMLMMSRCRHNIIANSSFSWWGQRLNDNRDKIVISPEYWFNEEADVNCLNSSDFVHVKNCPSFKGSNSNPRFSILVPVYNCQDTVRRCLSSVLNQSYENFEVILVDDASSDNSLELIKEYASYDERIRIIEREKNSSLLSARIAGMKEVRGDYILFLDSDDYLSLDTCSTLEKELSGNEVDILEFAYVREPEKKVVYSKAEYNNNTVRNILTAVYPHAVWNKCYSRDLVKRLLTKANDFYCNMSEDVYFTTLFFSLSHSSRRCDHVLYHYVVTRGMTHSAKMSIDSVNNAVLSIQNMEKNLKTYLSTYDNGSLIDYHKDIVDSLVFDMYSVCIKLDQPVGERIELLEVVDKEFGTSYATKYVSDMDTAYDMYESYMNWNGKRCLYLYKEWFARKYGSAIKRRINKEKNVFIRSHRL